MGKRKQKKDLMWLKKKVQNAKINNLQVWPKGSKSNKSNKLFCEIENSQITDEEALKRIENIHSDINKIISMQSLNLNQVNLLNILSMVNEIFTGESESIEVNKEGNFEVFKENRKKNNKNLMKNQILQILQICLN